MASSDRHLSLSPRLFSSPQRPLTRVTAVLYGPLHSSHSDWPLSCWSIQASLPLQASQTASASSKCPSLLSLSVICMGNSETLISTSRKHVDSLLGHRKTGLSRCKKDVCLGPFLGNYHFTQLLICMGCAVVFRYPTSAHLKSQSTWIKGQSSRTSNEIKVLYLSLKFTGCYFGAKAEFRVKTKNHGLVVGFTLLFF